MVMGRNSVSFSESSLRFSFTSSKLAAYSSFASFLAAASSPSNNSLAVSSSGAVLVIRGDLSQSKGRSIIVADSSPGFQSIRSIDGTRSDGIGLPARVISAPFKTVNQQSIFIRKD